MSSGPCRELHGLPILTAFVSMSYSGRDRYDHKAALAYATGDALGRYWLDLKKGNEDNQSQRTKSWKIFSEKLMDVFNVPLKRRNQPSTDKSK